MRLLPHLLLALLLATGAASAAKTKGKKAVPDLVLVSSPDYAVQRGMKVVANVFQGTGYWSSLRRGMMGGGRSDHGVVHFEGDIYVFGGLSASTRNPAGVVIANFTRYNMALGSMEALPPMPQPRYRFGYALVPETKKLYVFGGFAASVDQDPAVSGSTMVFDFVRGAWEPLTSRSPMMNFPRPDLAGAAVAGKVYAVGGYDWVYNTLSTVEVLDPSSGKWSFAANMSMSRGDLGVVAVNNTLYAIGGVTTSAGGTCQDWYSCHPWTAAVERYNPSTGKWSSCRSMKKARGDFAAEVLPSGRILVAGGESSYRRGTRNIVSGVAVTGVEEYHPDLDVWVPKAAMAEPRFRFHMAADGGDFVYAFGGVPSCRDPDCTSKTLDTIAAFYDDGATDAWIAKA